MTQETHIQHLEEEIKAIEATISDKEKNIDLLKIGVDIDKKKLKIMRDGLVKLRNKHANTTTKEG
jgi:hypothetical protein